MKRQAQAVLRAVFAVLVCLAAAFLISQAVRQSEWYKDRLGRTLQAGPSEEKFRAAVLLAQLKAQRQLLAALRADDGAVHELARRALEHVWFYEAGEEAYQGTQAAYRAAEKQDYQGALAILNQLVAHHPKFAEGWNQRASVYWQMGKYGQSAADCRQALALNPNHYGAWQGLGLCQLEEGDVAGACQSLRTALRILPHDPATRQSLRRCEELLRRYPGTPGNAGKMDII